MPKRKSPPEILALQPPTFPNSVNIPAHVIPSSTDLVSVKRTHRTRLIPTSFQMAHDTSTRTSPVETLTVTSMIHPDASSGLGFAAASTSPFQTMTQDQAQAQMHLTGTSNARSVGCIIRRSKKQRMNPGDDVKSLVDQPMCNTTPRSSGKQKRKRICRCVTKKLTKQKVKSKAFDKRGKHRRGSNKLKQTSMRSNKTCDQSNESHACISGLCLESYISKSFDLYEQMVVQMGVPRHIVQEAIVICGPNDITKCCDWIFGSEKHC